MKSKRQNINQPYIPAPQNKFSSIIKLTQDLILCPHCHRGISHSEVICAGGKETSLPRYFCKACKKKFGVRHRSTNWAVWFGRLYHTYLTKPYEKNAIIARHNDFMTKSAQRLFDRHLRHYRGISASLGHTIEKAFIDTVRVLQSKAKKRLNKSNRDNWEIIINHYDSEKSYDLDFKLFKAENAGITFLKKQDPINPLIHCHKCSGNNIIRYGFSPVGRRRLYCKDCEVSFVLQAKHLFTYTYVKEQLIKIFTRFNPENIRKNHMPILEEICTKIAAKFMHYDHLKEITQKLQSQFIVHELYRIREIEAFASKIPIKKMIVPMEILPAEEQDNQVAKLLMLGKPKEIKEHYASGLFEQEYEKVID